ncbi:MAG: sigma-70 family RNA polymerase sigma factor [Prevotella sp.]|nr:sigma-70 family RNA polymerase sigma factor [Prevotella sp.]
MEQKEFETVIRQIRPRLYAEAMRYLSDGGEAEDATQEVVLKLWSMRRELGGYRSVEALAVVMVRRLCLSRKRATLVPLTTGLDAADAVADDTPESELIDREEERQVIELMQRLPDAQQAVLRMKHIDGLETAEIARITGSTEEAVRANLSRARKKMLQMFVR